LSAFESTIVTSADGINWVQRQSRTMNALLDGIAYGNGQFVAVGVKNGLIITSSDGVNWLPRGREWLVAVAYGNGQFVAVGDDGIIWTSADAVKWVGRQSVMGFGSPLSGIAYGNGHFVAVGGGTILKSGNIITLAITPNADSGLLSLSMEGPTGLAYAIQSSTDLISWRNLTNITSVQPSIIVFDALPAASDRVFYRAYSQ